MASKTRVPRAKQSKPRGEQLLDRLDKDPNDQPAWDELARAPKSLMRKAVSSGSKRRRSG
jgi:hypothetical protein